MDDSIFNESEIHLTPVTGQFDVESVAAAIAPLSGAFRDVANPAMFVICGDDESREYYRERREVSPDLGFPNTLLIRVEPGLIKILPGGDEEDLPPARTFLTWLKSQYALHAEDEFGKDLTAQLG